MTKSPRRVFLWLLAFMVVISTAGAIGKFSESGSALPTNSTNPISSSVTTSEPATSATTSSLAPEVATNGVPIGLDGKVSAEALLSTIRVENEHSYGYDRELFHHWITVDAMGCSAREYVLRTESITPAQVDTPCYVVAGDWFSPYDNVTISDRGDVDIDHMVPLKEAWDSGAWKWDYGTRERYANDISDPRTLIAVTYSSNRSKGENDPVNWLRVPTSYKCTYLGEWVSIKARWGLSMDQSEAGYIRNQLQASCRGLRIRTASQPRIVFATSTNTPETSPTTATPSPTGNYVANDVYAGRFCKTEHRGKYALATNGRVVVCIYKGGSWRWSYY